MVTSMVILTNHGLHNDTQKETFKVFLKEVSNMLAPIVLALYLLANTIAQYMIAISIFPHLNYYVDTYPT